jgi:uncharacterized protein YvpB
MIKRLDFLTKHKQIHEGSCGPNIMKHILLNKYGLNIPERNLINISGCSQEYGTSVEGMMNIAENFNLNYSLKYNSSISDLIYSINKDNPVVILVQEGLNDNFKNWGKIWDKGHYIGINGFDKQEEKIFYYDPLYCKIKTISYENLNKKWHDKDSEDVYEHFAMFFEN